MTLTRQPSLNSRPRVADVLRLPAFRFASIAAYVSAAFVLYLGRRVFTFSSTPERDVAAEHCILVTAAGYALPFLLPHVFPIDSFRRLLEVTKGWMTN